MFTVNNKDTRTTPMAYFTPYSSVSIVNFQHVIAGWEQKCSMMEAKRERERPNNVVINPFLANAPILYPLKITEKPKVFWCF